jgi:hypothetical protein
MNNSISIYEKLIIKEVTYETGDNTVTAVCEIITGFSKYQADIIITHTDLNRIIAKLTAEGFEFQIKQNSPLLFDDGTEIIDYTFKNVFGKDAILENFHFTQNIQQIRA